MNKTLKKVLLAAAIAVGSVGLVWGILTLVRSVSREAVNVYAVSDFMTTDNWGNTSQSSGMVTTDKLQKVYLSSTQTVTKVHVEEGQNVKKGDKILEYDTSLSSLDVQMAQIQYERQELALKGLKNELTKLEKVIPIDKLIEQQEALKKQLEEAMAEARKAEGKDPSAPVPTVPTQQDGTEEHPYFYQHDGISNINISDILSGTPAALNDAERYVVLYLSNATGAEVYQGLIIDSSDSSFTLFTPDPDSLYTPDDISVDNNTAIQELNKKLKEINMLLADPDIPENQLDLLTRQQETREQIGQSEVELKLAELELQRKKSEVEDGAVYSTIDGIVKVVRSADEAFQNSEAVVEISGGGGYYVSGVINELDLGNLHIGDTVQINSWMTGANCEGEIVSVENYPSEQYGWGGGNNNVSYYPFKAFVSEDADLQENDYVDITYRSSASRNAWYLDNMFLRTENGKSYVYVRGENGTLEQRWVTTGAGLWGSYTEIRGGLSQDDYIAFPYGKDVTDGAKTQEATPNQLYGY